MSWFIKIFTVDSHTGLGPIDYILNTSAHMKKLLEDSILARYHLHRRGTGFGRTTTDAGRLTTFEYLQRPNLAR